MSVPPLFVPAPEGGAEPRARFIVAGWRAEGKRAVDASGSIPSPRWNATADREPWFDPDIRPRVHQYLGGTMKNLGGIPLAVGGVADHVHLHCKVRQDTALAAVVRDLKANTTAWFHDTFRRPGFVGTEVCVGPARPFDTRPNCCYIRV
ncbi:transposase [bacterium]|nr:transposase [bacterium]